MNPENIHARFLLRYPDFSLDVDLELPGRGVTALFGHSGSGKTTLLRCIAGLEQAQGTLRVNGEVWQDGGTFLPTHQRPLGYVFQEASLFPHLTARKNIEYGMKRTAAPLDAARLSHVIELLGIAQLLERKSDQLSGGERQRIGIARALAVNPRILLMDEPLASLDIKRKQEILPYLERLRDELEIPVLYVSHSPKEVARLADHLIALEGGCVVASGPLNETLTRLDSPLAHFDDAGAVIEATVAEHDEAYHLTRVEFPGGSLWVGRLDAPAGHAVRARVLARDVSLALEAPRGSSISNILPARIAEIRDEGPDKVNVRLVAGEAQQLLARITRRSRDQLGLTAGMYVCAQVKSVALMG